MYSCQALIDSGAEGNYLDFTLARKLKVPVFVLKNTISVIALSGQSLSPVTHTTGLIRLVTSGNHTEDIHFFLTNSPSVPVVLGHPWLTVHKPHINWDTIMFWLGVISVTLLVCYLPVLLCLVLCFRMSMGTCQTCPVSTST